jgi:hypothetical protein
MSERERENFRGELPPGQRRAFDKLATLMASPQEDMAWHHAVGGLVALLLPPEFRERGRVRWLEALARVFGRDVSRLQKSLRFHEEYPTEEELHQLERMGVTWSQVYLTLPIADRKERHRFLREVVEQDWRQPRLRDELRGRYQTGRHGVGGRKRRPVDPLAPETALREMGRLTLGWLDLHDGAWARLTAADWQQLVKNWPEEYREQFHQLVEETIRRVKSLLGKGKEVPCTLEDVRRTLKELMPGA